MEANVEELYKWIDGYSITRQKKNITRDFSDAVPLAEILKVHYPKFVDLHNYTPRNAISQKLVNWNMLNKKVLSRLSINLTKNTMDQLSKSVPGAVEKVLFEIKNKIDAKEKEEKKQKESTSNEVLCLEGLPENNSDPVLPIKVKNGAKISSQKIVPAEMFDNMQSDLSEKEETITNLKTKVNHLEALVSIKEERIKDLTNELQKVDHGTRGTKIRTANNTRFFKKIF